MLTGIPNWSLDYFGMPVIRFLLDRGIIEQILYAYFKAVEKQIYINIVPLFSDNITKLFRYTDSFWLLNRKPLHQPDILLVCQQSCLGIIPRPLEAAVVKSFV